MNELEKLQKQQREIADKIAAVEEKTAEVKMKAFVGRFFMQGKQYFAVTGIADEYGLDVVNIGVDFAGEIGFSQGRWLSIENVEGLTEMTREGFVSVFRNLRSQTGDMLEVVLAL